MTGPDRDTPVTHTPGTGSADAGAQPPTQLLARNLERLEGANLLLLGVPRDTGVVPLFGNRTGVLLSFDYGAHLAHTRLVRSSSSGLAPLFAATYAAPEPRHDVVVAYLQKGKEANDHLIATAASVVAPGGHVWLVGENSAGIKPYGAKLEERVGPLVSSDAARHCVLYEARATASRPEVPLDAWEKRYQVPVGTGAIDVVTLPGVFSHGRLDEGTAFLLRHLPARVTGAVLDFGCGSGVIGASLKAANAGADITLVDANAFALAATRRTFEVNGLAARDIRPVSGIDDVGEGRFDLIVTNPPFHQGIGTDYTVVGRFLESCEQHLTPDGVLFMVANRFLPYERMVPASMQVSLVAEDSKFKVLRGRLARRVRERR